MGSIDGNKQIGATAIIITLSNNYPNQLQYNNDQQLVAITYIGRGGRQISENKYTFTQNQPIQQNYPMQQSATYDTPVRVIIKQLASNNIQVFSLFFFFFFNLFI